MSIDFGRSIAFVVDDPRWFLKIGVIALLTLVAAALLLIPIVLLTLTAVPQEEFALIFDELAQIDPAFADVQIPALQFTSQFYLLIVPFIGGLAIMALLLGYYIELVRNVRLLMKHPLPAWNMWGQKFKDGFFMEVAYTGYLLANGAFFIVGLLLITQIGGLNAEMFRLVLAFCCLIPLVFVNGLVIILLTSIGVLPYSVTGDIRDFYRFGWVWRRVRVDTGLTARWFGYGILANFGLGVVQSLPVIFVVGYILSLFMSVTIQGHLLGQYAAALDEKYGNALEA